jgi:translocation and assembly module TamA
MMRVLAFFTLSCMNCFAIQPYTVHFIGIEDQRVLQSIKDASDLELLQQRPPASLNGLRYRIKQDIPNLLTVLNAYSYYDAEIHYEINDETRVAKVMIYIRSGPRYRLINYEITHGDCHHPLTVCSICPEQLGLELGTSINSSQVVNAEKLVLLELGKCGYPLAYIDQRRILADVAEKTVSAGVCVQEGPLARFGSITMFGLQKVHPRFIERKIAWREGEVFNSELIDETQTRLLKSDLFSSVLVSYGESLDAAGELPIQIRLAESKHRTLNLGVFYGTVDGPGGSFSWVHRNIGGVGNQLRFSGNVSGKFINGVLVYRIPDVWRFDQTFSLLAEASREHIIPYLAFTYRESNRIEREIDKQRTFQIGIKAEYISVHESSNNGTFCLLGLPVFCRYINSDSPLNPMKGYFLSYAATAYQSLQKGNVHFYKQQLQGAVYLPFNQKKICSLALQAFVGSIAGAEQKDIPLPKLFLGGSEDFLRGYSYKTVSPLKGNKPLGGRSAIFTSVELRWRIGTIGIVPFADFGTVALQELPRIDTKWFKSVGLGLRYFTFFGPFRLDVGFPLNKRKNIDTWGKVYASIGQSF